MSLLFSQLASKFLAWAASCKRPSTVAVYRHYLRRFLEAHGDLPVAEIRGAHLIESGKTWHHVQAVKRLFKWAVEEAGLLEESPVARVKHPPKGHRRRILSAVETRKILAASKADLRRLLLAYRETMARPGELQVAEWDDVHGDSPTIGTREALASQRACIVLWEFKCRSRRADPDAPRVIILSPIACRLLLWLYDRARDHQGRIFLTRRGRAWTANALRCRFRRVRARLNIARDKRGETIVPYTFRHTSATLAAAAGIRDRVLADVLGHVETKTTARYQHLQIEHLRHALELVWTAKPKRRS